MFAERDGAGRGGGNHQLQDLQRRKQVHSE